MLGLVPGSLRYCLVSDFLRKFLDYLGDSLDLGLSQFGINREAQAFARRPLGNRKITGFVPEIRKSLLKVQGHWVVHSATDLVRVKMPL